MYSVPSTHNMNIIDEMNVSQMETDNDVPEEDAAISTQNYNL